MRHSIVPHHKSIINKTNKPALTRVERCLESIGKTWRAQLWKHRLSVWGPKKSPFEEFVTENQQENDKILADRSVRRIESFRHLFLKGMNNISDKTTPKRVSPPSRHQQTALPNTPPPTFHRTYHTHTHHTTCTTIPQPPTFTRLHTATTTTPHSPSHTHHDNHDEQTTHPFPHQPTSQLHCHSSQNHQTIHSLPTHTSTPHTHHYRYQQRQHPFVRKFSKHFPKSLRNSVLEPLFLFFRVHVIFNLTFSLLPRLDAVFDHTTHTYTLSQLSFRSSKF